MSGRLYCKIGLLAVVALTSGCALNRDKNPHNDVLVFATHTKFGVDISAPLNSATLPAINVGYNRAEAVWMPLRPNGPNKDWILSERATAQVVAELNKCKTDLQTAVPDVDERNKICMATVLPQAKYVSMSSGIDSGKGGANLEIDTYSVFASFGARGGVSGSGAQGGLAQVFATGIAAQRLAANPQVGAALNAAAPQAVIAQARANEAAANAIAAQAPLRETFGGAWSCGDPATDAVKFKAIMGHADAALPDPAWAGYIGLSSTKQEAIDRLGVSRTGMMSQFIASQKVVCGGS